MSSAVERILEEKLDLIQRTMEEVRGMKMATPSLRCAVQKNYGSILNGYREGDLTFQEAVNALEARAPTNKKDADEKYTVMEYIIKKVAAVRTRANVWDLMYETEFHGDGVELNEVMACMTDEQVFNWYPGIIASYIGGRQ